MRNGGGHKIEKGGKEFSEMSWGRQKNHKKNKKSKTSRRQLIFEQIHTHPNYASSLTGVEGALGTVAGIGGSARPCMLDCDPLVPGGGYGAGVSMSCPGRMARGPVEVATGGAGV